MSNLEKVLPRIATGGGWLLAGLTAGLALSGAAFAQDEDPPTRVARFAYLEGSVSFEPAGTQDWVAPAINRPLTTGDALWADRDSRAELQLDGSIVRAAADTSMSFLNLGDRVTQIELSSGTLIVYVHRLRDQETYEIDTPNLAFTVLQPGVYRLTVDGTGGTTVIDVRRGQGEATGGGVAYSVFAGEEDAFAGTDQLVETQQSAIGAEDPFDAWSAQRDARWEHSPSARYVAPDIVGYEDLDDQGNWQSTSYGYMWFPRGVQPGWAPYQQGHWAYVPPWGYTWVDDNRWGFAPFHYGRWASVNGAWGWIPAPPPAPGAVYVPPVYAPALVAWVGAGAAVAWFALGPRDVYVPSYPVSRDYVDRVNVSNTNVSTTVINNVYKTNTVINNKTVNDIVYVNRSVPGAVTATSQQAFTSAEPVARSRVAVDARTLAAAPVRSAAPPIVPTVKAVLGSGKPAASHPPPAVLTRPIVARTAPPPPAPSFSERQHAIQSNGGRPLSAAQVRQIQPASGAASRAAPVRQAPAPHTLITSKPAAAAPKAPPAATPSGKPEAGRPAEAAHPSAPSAAPTHVKETPPPARPAAPGTAASVLERQQLQEQQQLHAQQEAERQRTEHQQQADHQKLAQQQAADAQKRAQEAALEQQHAKQTQELAQRHAAQQQELVERQQQQRSEQQVKPAEPKTATKPGAKPEPKPESKPKTTHD